MKMVGLFSGFIMDKNESRQFSRGRDEDDEHSSLIRVDGDDHEGGNEEDDGDDDGDTEFEPIKPPLEPPEDDEPAKCPMMPDLSFIYDVGDWKEPVAENTHKRGESAVTNEVDRKKLRERARYSAANQMQFRGPHYHIFDVFQQCREFGFS